MCAEVSAQEHHVERHEYCMVLWCGSRYMGLMTRIPDVGPRDLPSSLCGVMSSLASNVINIHTCSTSESQGVEDPCCAGFMEDDDDGVVVIDSGWS